MIVILLIVSTVTVVILLLRMAALFRAIDRIGEDVRNIVDSDSNTTLSSLSDNSHLKGLVEDLNQGLSSLREKRHEYNMGLSALRNGTEGIAHDLRTPLTSIKGYLELLSEEEISVEGRKYLSIIQGRVDYMEELTDELYLSLSMNSLRGLKMENADIKAILEEAIVSLSSTLIAHSLDVKVTLTEKKVIKRVDSKALYRVYVNIIENARKYSEGDLEILMDGEGRAIFSNASSSLEKVDLAYLFDRYYTVERARSSSGLGLSIARRLTEEMGGKVEAEKRDGRLSISVFFP